ncbi:EAL domain-containing protein [Sphingosinicella terrae]|uniref:EAL domain-containing protein n=1 Tax=Sphingosinicella terrae TaxID=2172047 RepID=UPI000E0CF971|nr:EAL domain-containing protein [Sphingosinicella terrae]
MLAELVDQLPGLVYRCEPKAPWRMRYMSAQVEPLTGYAAVEFLEHRLTWADMVHPSDLAMVVQKIETDLAIGHRFSLDYRIIDRFGQVRWVMEQGLITEGTDGPMLDGFIQDVTESRRNAIALRAGQAQLDTVFDQSLVGILHRDLSDRLLHVNRAFCDLVGRSPEQLDGMPISELWHPDDAESIAAQVRRDSADGRSYRAERRYLRPDGSACWVDIQVSFIRGDDGEIDSVLSVVVDATERRRVEAQRLRANDMLRMALDGADAGTFELNLEDFALRLSPEAVRIYGLPRDHDGRLSHEEWLALVDPRDSAHPPPVRAAGDGHALPRAFEFRLRERDGEVRWLRALSHPIPAEAGGGERLFGLIFDDTERKLAEQKLQSSEAHLRLVQEVARIGSYRSGPDFVAICSPQFYRNLGLAEDTPSLSDAAYIALIHPEDRQRTFDHWRAVLESGAESIENEFRIIRADNGEARWLFNRTRILRDGEGRYLGAIGSHMDVTDRKQAEEAARAGEALNLGIIQASADAIALLDPDGRLTFMNGHALAAAGAGSFEPIAGRPWCECWPDEVRAALDGAIAVARSGGVGRFAGATRVAGEEKWWDVAVTSVGGEIGRASALLAIARDVTDQRRSVERVRWAASHDALTTLPNRAVFQDRLSEALALAGACGRRVGLLMLDIDHFKEVNDERGHDAGDALLRAFAERLRGAVRRSDFVARLGGDEFAVILADIAGPEEIEARLPPILERLQVPVAHLGRSLDCRASVGGAFYPDQGETPDELMKNADLALYAAKLTRRGGVTLFTPTMRSEMQDRISMLNLARDAIRKGLILPYYQPQIDLRSGDLVGFEALLRWRHPELGIQPPATIAEAFGDAALARQLGEQMQALVFEDMRLWLDAGLPFGRVAINTSAAEFRNDDFAESLLDRLGAAGVPNGLVEVEITERTVFQGKNSEYVARALGVLRDNKVRVALDDFGTGFSSLSHLKQFAVDALKIDQSFIHDLGSGASSDDGAIVLAVLNLGRSLDIEVVGEGIETQAQADFLRSHGCDTGQGYLFGRAVSGEQVMARLAGARRRAAG